MVKTAGLIFIAILAALPLLALDHLTGSGYLSFFAKEQSINVMVTLLALNVAVVTFLIGHLINLETKYNKRFGKTRNELRHNIYFMAVMVSVNFLVVSANNQNLFNVMGVDSARIMGYTSTVLAILVIMAMLEIVKVSFSMDGVMGVTSKPRKTDQTSD